MKIEEYLQKQSDKMAEQRITEGDRAFAHSLPLNPRAKRNKTFWAAISTIATVCVAAIVLIPTLIVHYHKDAHYKDDEIASKLTELTSILTDSKCFDFSSLSYLQNEYIMKHYDTVSNDTLYYTCSASSDLIKLSLTIVVNERYQYPFKFQSTTVTTSLENYDVTYCKITFDTDYGEVQTAYYGGEIKVKSETVYFEYTQIIATSDDAFFADLQSLIQIKQ